MKKFKYLVYSATLCALLPLSATPLSGLWLATVEVDKVNEVHSKTKGIDILTDVKYTYNLQYVLHSNALGKTKLLREVYIMQTTKDQNKSKRVLVTEQERWSDFEGIIRKGDNKLVPVRFTSPSIDFDMIKNIIDLNGILSVGGTITSPIINHSPLHPTNPFRHQFHPNHTKGVDFNRTFSIKLTAPTEKAGTGKTPPNVGRTSFKGTYTETVTGIHHKDLKVSGSVILTQISTISTLNPSASGD
ncbi:MAG: hypothetical protein QM493_10715 [Sulfurovum sp.]